MWRGFEQIPQISLDTNFGSEIKLLLYKQSVCQDVSNFPPHPSGHIHHTPMYWDQPFPSTCPYVPRLTPFSQTRLHSGRRHSHKNTHIQSHAIPSNMPASTQTLYYKHACIHTDVIPPNTPSSRYTPFPQKCLHPDRPDLSQTYLRWDTSHSHKHAYNPDTVLPQTHHIPPKVPVMHKLLRNVPIFTYSHSNTVIPSSTFASLSPKHPDTWTGSRADRRLQFPHSPSPAGFVDPSLWRQRSRARAGIWPSTAIPEKATRTEYLLLSP